MRSDLRLLLILAVAICGTQCVRAPEARIDEAVSRFGREHSCPAGRLQVKHAEVRLPDLVEVEQPPAEVAADADRLAVWRQTVDKELASYEHVTAVDVTGCGSHATYFCWYQHVLHRAHECFRVDLDDPHPDFMTLTLKTSARQSVRQRLGLLPTSPRPPEDSARTTAAPQAQIQQMIEARTREIESKLNRQYDDNLKQLQKRLEQSRHAAAGQNR